MKKWMIVLMAMIIAMPLSSDLYAANKKKKKKGTPTATVPAPKKVSSYEKLFKGKNVVTAKSNFITLHKVGDKLEVTYYRNGQKQTTTVSLTETNNPSL